MVKSLERVAAKWRLLAEEQEHANDFYTIVSARDSLTFGIGMSSVSGTLGPALIIPTPDIWILGYNMDVSTLEMGTLTIMGHVKYESTFFAFANEGPEPPFLAIFETGVVGLDGTGRKLWEHATDIIIDFQRSGQSLNLAQMDGPPLRLDISTGQVSQNT
jgi:hypothetical protein